MFKKVFLGLILCLMLVCAVSAIDTTSFTVPDDFEDVGDGVYVLYDTFKQPEQVLSVVSNTEHDAEDYTTNDTENGYTVYAYENNTFNFVDESLDEKSSFELIEIDGEMFIIVFAKYGIGDENDFNETFDNLMKFNELNGVDPIEFQ